MAMSKFVVTLPFVSGIPRDVTQNTFYADTAVASTGGVTFAARIVDFYNSTQGTSASTIAARISRQVSRGTNACTIEQYVLPAAPGPTGSPLQTFNWTLGATDGSAYNQPNEIAICLSFHGDYASLAEESGSTRPRARHRGRVYIGPLNTNSSDVVAGSTDAPHPTAATMDVITDAAQDTIGISGDDPVWSVFSRTNWALYPVVEAWCDNEFDTQRRRGLRASTRTTVAIP